VEGGQGALSDQGRVSELGPHDTAEDRRFKCHFAGLSGGRPLAPVAYPLCAWSPRSLPPAPMAGGCDARLPLQLGLDGVAAREALVEEAISQATAPSGGRAGVLAMLTRTRGRLAELDSMCQL